MSRRSRSRRSAPAPEGKADALVAAGLARHRAGALDAALQHYRAALARNPGHPDALHLSGLICLQQGRAEEAVAAIGRAIDARPGFAEAHNNLGLALSALGRRGEAEAAFRRAIALQPSFAPAHSNLGNALLAAGQAEAAAAAYRQALAHDPTDAETAFNLGTALVRTGDRAAACQAYRRALRTAPGLLPALHNLAHLLAEDGRWAELQAAAEASARAHPQLAAPWFHLGRAQAALGQASAASESFRASLARDPDDALGAGLALAALGAAPPPQRHTAAYVRRFYEEKRFAGAAEDTGYRGHTIVLEALHGHLRDRTGLNVLDAGCGSGRIGREIRPAAARLVGVDLSPGMAARARATGVYDLVIEGDIGSHLAASPEAYDLVVAAAVLVHYGDLHGILRLVRSALKPDGAAVFTVFAARPEPAAGFAVAETGLFVHGRGHIEAAAAAAGLTAVDIALEVHEYHGDVPRHCYRVLAHA